jgi:hypothetical protein
MMTYYMFGGYRILGGAGAVYSRSNGLQSGTITKKTELQCNSAMPDFIIAGEKVIIRKSPNHIQNTLLIGDSTSLLVIK